MNRKQRDKVAIEHAKAEAKLKTEIRHSQIRAILYKWSAWFLRKTWAFILGIATWISLQQFVISNPEIAPVDFGAKGSNPLTFTIHNPLLVSMYDAEAGLVIGDVMMGAGTENLQMPFPSVNLGAEPCERLERHPTLAMAYEKLDAQNEMSYGEIKHGESVTFPSSWEAGNRGRATFAVAVRYSVKPFGLFSLWKRFTCNEYQTAADSEGRVHLLPYLRKKASK